VGDTIAFIDTSVIALRLQQAEASRTAMLTRRRQAQIQIEQTALSESLAGKEFERLERLVKAGSAINSSSTRRKMPINRPSCPIKRQPPRLKPPMLNWPVIEPRPRFSESNLMTAGRRLL